MIPCVRFSAVGVTLNTREKAKIDIRLAVPGDIDALCEIEDQSFEIDRLNRRAFKRFVGSETARLCVAYTDDGVVGYALVIFRRNVALARLYSLAVSPQWRGQGIGQQLITRAEELSLDFGAPILRLEVSQKNDRAISLFHAAGYREFALYPDYYPDHSDALRMEKVLVPNALRLPSPFISITRHCHSPAARRP